MKTVLPLLVFALGCATRSPNLEATANLETNVPACIDGTVADPEDARQSVAADTLRRFLVDAGYRDVRFVGMPDAMPALRNVDDVQRAIMRLYPAVLRDAGIGGAPTALILVDTVGVVIHRRIVTSSGHAGVDAAAEEVIGAMRFSPAVVDGCRASFLSLIPVTFRPSARSNSRP